MTYWTGWSATNTFSFSFLSIFKIIFLIHFRKIKLLLTKFQIWNVSGLIIYRSSHSINEQNKINWITQGKISLTHFTSKRDAEKSAEWYIRTFIWCTPHVTVDFLYNLFIYFIIYNKIYSVHLDTLYFCRWMSPRIIYIELQSQFSFCELKCEKKSQTIVLW